MADSSNQPKLDQQQSLQPLLAPQMIAVNSTASISQPTSLPVARPAAPVVVRPSINHAGPARSLFVIRPSAASTLASPTSRIIVQQNPSHPIVAQTVTPPILTPSPLDADNQPDASNAPVATLLRNAPISMRFDGQPHPITAKPLPDRLSLLHRLPGGPGNCAAAATKLKIPPATQGATPSSIQRKVIREMQVRVCTRPDRKFSVLRYNAYDRIDLSGASSGVPSGDNRSSSSTLQEVFLQRENNLRQYKATHSIVDAPTRGAGSEFGQEAKEEARLRRLGIVRQGYRVEDQPWLLTVGKGRTAKRYKGVREGSVSTNVRHFIFCQTKDGNFDAYPVHEWYKFNPEVNYRFLRDEEAEAEYSRRHKTLNLFNVMVKRKMADESTEEGSVDTNEPNVRTRTGMGSVSKGDKSVKRNRSSALLLTELDEWKSLGLDEEEEEEEEEEYDNEGGAGDEETAKTGDVDDDLMKRSDDAKKRKTDSKKKRAAAIVARKRRATKQRARRRRKGAIANSSGEEDDVNEEAWDESDPDDHEGDEVDYMTDSSSDEEKLSEDDREQIYQEQGVDEEAGLKVLLTDISDSEEEFQSKPEDSNLDEYDVEEEGAEGDDNRTRSDGNEHKSKSRESKARRIKANSLDSSSNDDDSDESSDDSSSDSSSSSGSDSDLAPDDPAHLARKAQKKEELLQRISEKVSVTHVEDQPSSTTGVKRFRNEPTPVTTDPANAPKRPKQVEPASDDTFTAAVRKYLMRKPITVSDLLKKIRSKRLVPHASQPGRGTSGSGTDDIAETMLANALRQLRPLKHIVNGQPFLSLKR